MSEFTTIQVDKRVMGELKKLKKYQRETYNELIASLIEYVKKKEHSQYDEFLHRAQQAKMKELWGEGDYSAWEHA